jgi:hypothetical protein
MRIGLSSFSLWELSFPCSEKAASTSQLDFVWQSAKKRVSFHCGKCESFPSKPIRPCGKWGRGSDFGPNPICKRAEGAMTRIRSARRFDWIKFFFYKVIWYIKWKPSQCRAVPAYMSFRGGGVGRTPNQKRNTPHGRLRSSIFHSFETPQEPKMLRALNKTPVDRSARYN